MKPFEEYEELHEAMEKTQQTAGVSILEHGRQVRAAYLKLIEHLEAGDHEIAHLYGSLKPKLLDDASIARYQVYHDCGKPLCALEGRFPGHAALSHQQWLTLYPEDVLVAELMKLDMAFHTLRGDELKSLWLNPLAPTLYLTAWAELEANAAMFGGHCSDSYKIKRKRLIQAGKKM